MLHGHELTGRWQLPVLRTDILIHRLSFQIFHIRQMPLPQSMTMGLVTVTKYQDDNKKSNPEKKPVTSDDKSEILHNMKVGLSLKYLLKFVFYDVVSVAMSTETWIANNLLATRDTSVHNI